jgi:hypothetical protein
MAKTPMKMLLLFALLATAMATDTETDKTTTNMSPAEFAAMLCNNKEKDDTVLDTTTVASCYTTAYNMATKARMDQYVRLVKHETNMKVTNELSTLDYDTKMHTVENEMGMWPRITTAVLKVYTTILDFMFDYQEKAHKTKLRRFEETAEMRKAEDERRKAEDERFKDIFNPKHKNDDEYKSDDEYTHTEHKSDDEERKHTERKHDDEERKHTERKDDL